MSGVAATSSTPVRSPPPSATDVAAKETPKQTGFGSADRFEAPATRKTAPLEPAKSTVIEGDVTIRSAADLEKLKGITQITGKLIIEGDIKSLAGLESLTSVGGLELRGTQLTSLAGLSGLKTIQGDLKVLDNPKLESLSGLAGVQTITGNLSIGAVVEHGDDGFISDVRGGGNPRLTSLGLKGLRSVGGDLSIASNPALTKLDGLENLRTVGGQLDVIYNAELRSVKLPSLESAGRVQIGRNPVSKSPSADGQYVVLPHGNDALETIDLPRLVNAKSVVIADNNALTSVKLGALGGDGSLVEKLRIATNPHLESISAPNLQVVGDLDISQSAGLPVRDADGVLVYDPPISGELKTIDLPKLRSVTNLNVSMCPRLEELSLPSLETVSGDLFLSNDPMLRSFSAPRLTEITGIAYIGETAALSSLDGLGGLQKVGHLYIQDLPSLASLDGLGSLRTIAGDLQVVLTGIPSLAADALRARFGVGGEITLHEPS